MEHNSACNPQATAGAITRPTLIDPMFDQDSCGVGFVATMTGISSHEIVQHALTALGRLAHRGATASDGKSSDGVGLMTAIPRQLLLREARLELAADRDLAVGMVFLPAGEERMQAALERCLSSHDLELLGWREVPVNTAALGEIALGRDAAHPAGFYHGHAGGRP